MKPKPDGSDTVWLVIADYEEENGNTEYAIWLRTSVANSDTIQQWHYEFNGGGGDGVGGIGGGVGGSVGGSVGGGGVGGVGGVGGFGGGGVSGVGSVSGVGGGDSGVGDGDGYDS